jgi:hypothetical protein
MGKKVVAGESKQTHTVYPRCGLHKKYKGINPARADCRVCQEIYVERNKEVTMK